VDVHVIPGLGNGLSSQEAFQGWDGGEQWMSTGKMSSNPGLDS
jgi:hypothetical protein